MKTFERRDYTYDLLVTFSMRLPVFPVEKKHSDAGKVIIIVRSFPVKTKRSSPSAEITTDYLQLCTQFLHPLNNCTAETTFFCAKTSAFHGCNTEKKRNTNYFVEFFLSL